MSNECEVCLFKGKSNNTLLDHYYANHLDLKRWKCNSCTYSAKNKTTLDFHRRKHEGKVYKCDECSFKTFAHAVLSEHTRYHHDKEEVICNICRAFVRNKAHLPTHMIAHKERQKWVF